MTGSPDRDRLTPSLQEIEAIEAQLKANPTDWTIKMRLAEALERHGRATDAKKLYQQVVAADPGGAFADKRRERGVRQLSGGSFQGALETSLERNNPQPRIGQWFYNLPIRRKLLVVLLGSKLISISALAIALSWWLAATYQRLLLQKASERAIVYFQDATTKKIVNELISGNRHLALPAPPAALDPLSGSYSALYLHDGKDEFISIAARETILDATRPAVTLPNTDLLGRAVAAKGGIVTGWAKIGQNSYAIAAKAMPPTGDAPQPVLVLGTLETGMAALLGESLAVQLLVTVVVLAADIMLAGLAINAIATPIRQMHASVQQLSEDGPSQIPVLATDEIGQLAASLNQLVATLDARVNAMEEQARRLSAEIVFQQREKEGLQQGIRQLLQDIADTKHGDLTVRGKVEAGELGAVAASFNATIASFYELVIQVQIAANQLQASTRNSSGGMQKLAQNASSRAGAIAKALDGVADVGRAMQSVASSTLQAAVIARQGVLAARNGYKMMNQTVTSIEQIRHSLAAASQKVNRLSESSLEISKIVTLISTISERTNILAFNASIAAAREKSEQGQVFRAVANEVQRLAERVTDSAKEIEQLVSAMQEGVADARATMESSSETIETGAEQLVKTQQTLRKLAGISHNINQLLQSISASTVSQAQSSREVSQTLQAASALAEATSTESSTVVDALSEQVKVAETLQDLVSRFRVDEKKVREPE